MANNRIYLANTSIDCCLFMGKTLGAGWYKAPEKEQIEKFYDKVSQEGDKGRFFIFDEDDNHYYVSTERIDGFHKLYHSGVL